VTHSAIARTQDVWIIEPEFDGQETVEKTFKWSVSAKKFIPSPYRNPPSVEHSFTIAAPMYIQEFEFGIYPGRDYTPVLLAVIEKSNATRMTHLVRSAQFGTPSRTASSATGVPMIAK
jgi:hypothetical protein